MFLCGHAHMVRGMSAHGVRTCPVFFSPRENLPWYLAICVNNIISMCIGVVHDIFTRNVQYSMVQILTLIINVLRNTIQLLIFRNWFIL